MPEYYTYKSQVPLKPGQTLGFTPGRGYYAKGTPTPTKPAPAPAPAAISDAASGGGYATPAARQPVAAAPQPVSDAASGGGYATPAARQPVRAAPQPVSDAASGGGYATTAVRQPVRAAPQPVSDAASGGGDARPADAPPKDGPPRAAAGKPRTTPATNGAPSPPQRPDVSSGRPDGESRAQSPATISDAASGGGYGTRYYTYERDVPLMPGQRVGFVRGRGYFAYYLDSPKPKPVSPMTPTPSPVVPSTVPTAFPAAGLPRIFNPEPGSFLPVRDLPFEADVRDVIWSDQRNRGLLGRDAPRSVIPGEPAGHPAIIGKPRQEPPRTLAQKLKTIRVHGIAIVNPEVTVEAIRDSGIRPALALALLSQESSGGHNIWGHDATIFAGGYDAANKRFYGKQEAQSRTVTRAGYDAYTAERARTRADPQGVGPTQLTDLGLQKMADFLGGAWKPLPNMIVGFERFGELLQQAGSVYSAAFLYNAGSLNPPPAAAARATEYARSFVAFESAWATQLRGTR